MTTGERSAGSGLLRATSYAEAIKTFTWSGLWSLFDGDRENLNIAVECLDRHGNSGTALRLRRSDGQYQEISFAELATTSSRFAHFLEGRGVQKGDAIAVMIEPSLEFYSALFGAIKVGAAAVPLFTLFGPEALRLRLDDCHATLLIVDPDRALVGGTLEGHESIVFDRKLLSTLDKLPDSYETSTKADDIAVLQYTSGTSRQLPDAIRHSHRAIVTVVLAAMYGVGLRPGDSYFCPSSPAWGHGLWHGTMAPWALGMPTGAYAGRFSSQDLIETLRKFDVTNFAAAGTVYRMLLRDELIGKLPHLKKASYTGEALEVDSLTKLRATLGTPVCGMYGTTETGVVIGNYPGFHDYEVRDGALGKQLPGYEVAIVSPDGLEAPPGVTGEISVRRRGTWFPCKDQGRLDGDGYFWYLGRSDDVIISAGWTISPTEVESVLVKHADVYEAIVVGVPDSVRGQVLKAFVVSRRSDDAMRSELQDLVRSQLSQHEYPRIVEFVDDLPRTPNGKVSRRAVQSMAIGIKGS